MTIHKLYLDPYLDMYNGEIISYSIDKHPSAINVMNALNKAIEATADCPYRRTFHSEYAICQVLFGKIYFFENATEQAKSDGWWLLCGFGSGVGLMTLNSNTDPPIIRFSI